MSTEPNYPKVRFVFSSAKNSAAPYGAHVAPEMPITFDFVEICVLRRSDMRQLVAKFKGGADTDVLLDTLQAEFEEINLPFTAANGSLLMTILQEQSGFRPINRSVLIEQFVDTTLRKAAEGQSQRETYDYSNKTALLACIASWMAMQNNYKPTSEELRDVAKKYFDQLGLNAPIDELLKEFHNARILTQRSEGRVSFRYRAVLEYFIALQMQSNESFKAWVMEDERYLQYPNEILYYAGKLRNDANLVDLIGDRFLGILDEVFSRAGGEIDLSVLEVLKLPTKKESASIDRLTLQLASPPIGKEEKDSELETNLPKDVEHRQEVFRPQVSDPGQQLMVSLILYSGVVKNMELIDDTSKRRHLEHLWKGWSIFLQLSLGVVADLAQQRKIRINGVLYEINAPVGMEDAELARLIALNLPVGISRLMSASLGTEKLERQLVEPTLDATAKPLVFEFLRAALIADLRLAATPGSLKYALALLRGSRYLLEALTWKIAELRRLDRLKSEDFESIQSSLAEAIVAIRGIKKERNNRKGTKVKQEELKSRTINKLEKQGFLLKIRKKFQDE